MKLKPDEMHVVAALRTIKGAGKVTAVKSESGKISVQTSHALKPVSPIQQSASVTGQVRLRG